jgi:hypothetical protein
MPNIPNTIFKLPLKYDYQKKNFNDKEETKAYLIYDFASGNYTVIYTNNNTTNMLQYIYEIDAGMDCYLYSPGVYNIVFTGEAEVCDPLKFWDVQNFCAVRSYITINALSSQNATINGSDFYFGRHDDDHGPPILPIVLGSLFILIICVVAGVIIFKYKCFSHLCKKQDQHPHQQLPKDVHDGTSEIEVHVDQK